MRLITPVLLALALLIPGCGRRGQTEADAASKAKPDPITVRVATAETRHLGSAVSVTGSLQPDETVAVSSEVAGRLAEVRYDFGQTVHQGDIIAELDKRELNIQCERARAALAQALAAIGLDPRQEDVTPESTPAIRQAKAQMEDARFKFDMAAKLYKTGDVSEERYIEIEKGLHAREAGYEATRDMLRTQLATVQALRADVRFAEKRLGDATVRAPFDGQISARLVSPGQYMRENTPIVTLVKSWPLRLRADIPEFAATAVRTGGTLVFTTDAAPGAQFHARVTELDPTLDAHSRSLSVEARLTERDPQLRPGMFVQVQLALAGDTAAVVVPKEALYQLAGLTKVFTVSGGRVVENKVTPGVEVGGWIEIPGGAIHAGDQVAVSKLPTLIDGLAVRTEAGR
ncbi:MAG: efflux RND transporter periplasmic adaptor subunit [Bryobacteraceae bacterium]|jgi:RND family efflux transporter MFP subunit